jgi:hypothetical protein
MATQSPAPWYRHRWPWILMAGPAIVVVAGIGTAVLAVETDDPVVADDYYTQGLGINRQLAREQHARDLAVGATLQFNDDGTGVRASIRTNGPMPAALRLSLLPLARTAEKQEITLAPLAPGVFEGPMKRPQAGNWDVELEDGAATWHLEGAWRTGSPQVALGANG